jgi:hypothetical protein
MYLLQVGFQTALICTFPSLFVVLSLQDCIFYCSYAAVLMKMLPVHVRSLSLHPLMNLSLMMLHCYLQASV